MYNAIYGETNLNRPWHAMTDGSRKRGSTYDGQKLYLRHGNGHLFIAILRPDLCILCTKYHLHITAFLKSANLPLMRSALPTLSMPHWNAHAVWANCNGPWRYAGNDVTEVSDSFETFFPPIRDHELIWEESNSSIELRTPTQGVVKESDTFIIKY